MLRENDPETTQLPLLDFARHNGVTQIFIPRPQGAGWPRLMFRDPVQEIIDLARDMQIVNVSECEPAARR